MKDDSLPKFSLAHKEVKNFMAIAAVMLLLCFLSSEISAAPQSEQTPSEKTQTKRAAVDTNKFAMVIAGVGGEEEYTKKFTAQAMRLYDTLTNKLGFDEKRVYLLTENVVSNGENVAAGNFARSTAEETRKAFAAIKAAAKSDNLVFVCFIGHGTVDNNQAKFNLVGPDLAAKDYAALLNALPTHKVVVVNASSSSGDFIKDISANNRIVITATRSGNEQNVTYFVEPFIAALTDPAADADKNGRVSLLEAFNYATKVTADWYKQKGRLATEHALLDDNGDGTGHEQATDGDGAIAKTTYLDSKTMEEANADVEVMKLLEDKQRLEQEIEKLKARKREMKAEEYESELERLLVELAKTTRAIKTRKR